MYITIQTVPIAPIRGHEVGGPRSAQSMVCVQHAYLGHSKAELQAPL